MTDDFTRDDARFMAACLRYARRHRGFTASNPSVGTLLVKDDIIVGRGITAKGGRPHAETIALKQAGSKAHGSTAYVSLEPCAHHGVTPPCAQALIDAGVSRVVTAWTDPDRRVDGQGHAMLRDAGIEVATGLHAQTAENDLRGYLNRKTKNRPQVILKLALSADGFIGKIGKEVTITGPLARAYGHRIRAEVDGILVGCGTVEADDPDLTCRLDGLESRSPHRFILDSKAALSPNSRLAKTARSVPVSIVTAQDTLPGDLSESGINRFAAETHQSRIALPEMLEDMASMGMSTLLVEGGAELANSLLKVNLVDTLALFTSPKPLHSGIISPIEVDTVAPTFALERQLQLGDDTLHLFNKSA